MSIRLHCDGCDEYIPDVDAHLHASRCPSQGELDAAFAEGYSPVHEPLHFCDEACMAAWATTRALERS